MGLNQLAACSQQDQAGNHHGCHLHGLVAYKSSQRQPQKQASYKTAQVAHVVDCTEDATANLREPKNKINESEGGCARKNSAFLTRGKVEIAEFHSSHHSANNPEDGAGSAKFSVVHVI